MRGLLTGGICVLNLNALALGAFISIPGVAVAQDITPEQDARNRINYAGRQRMLSQQIARNTCFVMAGIDPDRFGLKTDASVRMFSESMDGLRYGDTNLGLRAESNPEVVAALAVVDGHWATYRPATQQIAAGDFHSIPMRQLIVLSNKTLRDMHAAVGVISDIYGTNTIDADLARTINLAGRQRMLSQRVTKEICFFKLKMEFASTKDMVEGSIAEFETAMAQLIDGDEAAGIVPPPSREIAHQLKRTEDAWGQFVELVRRLENDEVLSEDEKVSLANMSDQVLLEMNLAVTMYTQ